MQHICRFLVALFGAAGLFYSASAQQVPNRIPPGTVAVGDSLFIDKTEVTNLHWREFLYYVQKDSGKAMYWKMLPDTMIWYKRNLPSPQTSSIDLAIKYFRKPEYQSFPVVGITYEQAQAYASWRSAVVTQMLNQPGELAKMGLSGKKVVVEYRLPTEAEWMAAAAGKRSPEKYPYGHKKYLKKPGNSIDPELAYKQLQKPKPPYESFKKELRSAKLPIFHVVAELPSDISVAPEFPKPAAAGPTNSLDLPHLIGNVAEMTATPGIAKGGSFMHTLENSKITDRQAYEGPAPWLGLRYVATIKVVKDEVNNTTEGY